MDDAGGPPTSFKRKEGIVRSKRLWLVVAAFATLFLGLIPALAVFVTAFPHFGLLAFLTFVLWYAAPVGLLALWERRWLERRGYVRADDRGLWLDQELIVPRGTVRHGHVVRRDSAVFVRLGRWMRLVDVPVVDEEEGGTLLAAMRLDPARSVGTFPMHHGTLRGALVRAIAVVGASPFVLLALLVYLDTRAFVLPALLAWAALILPWTANQAVRVSVGADGVRLRRLLSGSRFIPFSAFVSAEANGRNVRLRIRDGSIIEIYHGEGRGWIKALVAPNHADEATMLVERINAQAELHRRGGSDVRVLARGARETRDWLREVTLASDAHASFRAPAVPPDELWRVVADPTAAATARAGAAAALREGLDDDGRARLRVLAEACAAPKLRVALEVVASEREPEALEQAFEELHDPPEALRRLARRE